MFSRYAYHQASCSRIYKRPLLVSFRRNSTQVPSRILTGDDLGPTRSDLHQTWRVRKDPTSQDLPLPPLLDPLVLEKRSHWQQTKRQPKTAEFTSFQKKLAENPFAHALASPVRQCRATLISLPLAFLVSLHARPHPTTNHPWLLPVSMTTDDKHLGPPVLFIGRKAVVASLAKKKPISPRMSQRLAGHGLNKMVWREDMPDFILQMMRQKLFRKLSWNFGFKGRLIPVASPRTEDINHVEEVSCVLFFGSHANRADDLQAKTDAIHLEMEKWSNYFGRNFAERIDPHLSPGVSHHSPHWYTEPLVPRLQPRLIFPELEFHTTIWRGRKVAVYSLHDLLGQEMATALIEGSKYSDAGCVALKSDRHHVPVQMLLMQLQAYIAPPGA